MKGVWGGRHAGGTKAGRWPEGSGRGGGSHCMEMRFALLGTRVACDRGPHDRGPVMEVPVIEAP